MTDASPNRNATPIARAPSASALLALLLAASPATGQMAELRSMYTKPDRSASGGIRGTVTNTPGPLLGAYALPPAHPERAYRARIPPDAKTSFQFEGLPAATYDLVLVFEGAFFEGLSLSAGKNTLTDEDRTRIRRALHQAEPLFNHEVLFRAEGRTGTMQGDARCVAMMVRTKDEPDFVSVPGYPDYWHSLKLVLLQDIGLRWQVVMAREIHGARAAKPGEEDSIRHVHAERLSGIEVTDTVVDLGSGLAIGN